MNASISDKIAWYENKAARKREAPGSHTEMFSVGNILEVRKFHKTLPQFQTTPLTGLPHLAGLLNVASIRIKDESRRCGLNAFKVLGASYGICMALAEHLNLKTSAVRFDDFFFAEIRNKLKAVTLVTATDGNHGRAVAWMAEQLGCRSVVLMPKGSSQVRLENIRRHGADAWIIDGNYDDAVQMAAGEARKNGWLLIQDTMARRGYHKIPTWIMQGYAAMIDEACEQMGNRKPSHVFAQCGVGSFAASIEAYLTQKYGHERPVFTVVEPTRAACFFESITSKSRKPVKIRGKMDTIMAGLACGEPSRLAWRILKNFSDVFVICPDKITARGMRILANPSQGDAVIISGESGAVTLGLLVEILCNPGFRPLKQALGIDKSSDVLLFSTEGDTDPESYLQIVGSQMVSHKNWFGELSSKQGVY